MLSEIIYILSLMLCTWLDMDVDEICSEFVQVYRALLIFAPKTSETRQ